MARKTFTRNQLLAILGADGVAQLDKKIAASRQMVVPESDVLMAVAATVGGKRQPTAQDYYRIGRACFVWLNAADNVPQKERVIAWCNAHIQDRQNKRIQEVQG